MNKPIKKVAGTSIVLLSVSVYLVHLASATMLLYCLHRRYVHKMPSRFINNLITISGVGTIVSIVFAVGMLMLVNSMVSNKESHRGQESNRAQEKSSGVFGDCLKSLILWWCCCGPRNINICSQNDFNRRSSSESEELRGLLILFVAVFSVAMVSLGYFVYLAHTVKKLCNLREGGGGEEGIVSGHDNQADNNTVFVPNTHPSAPPSASMFCNPYTPASPGYYAPQQPPQGYYVSPPQGLPPGPPPPYSPYEPQDLTSTYVSRVSNHGQQPGGVKL